MRLRAALLALAATALTLFGPVPAQAADPPQPFRVAVTCDVAGGQVTAGTVGGTGSFVPNKPVTVEFRYNSGSWVRAGLVGHPAPVPPVRVDAVTGADGSLVTSGYVRAWPDATSYAFYDETVQATVVDRATGQQIRYQTGTCTRDTRTTATVTCDPVANTISAQATGIGFTDRRTASGPPIAQVTLTYQLSRTAQATPDSPRFTGTWGTVATHTVPVVDGTWSDVGYTSRIPDGSYYYRDDVRVIVSTDGTLTVLGRATASCEYRDAA